MTLTELRYVVAVAEQRHFGRAALACHVSQPTLSLGVKKLEEELGVALFERGYHEVLLTPAGRRIIDQARRVLTEVQLLKRLASEGSDPLRGTLRLGAIYTIGPYLLPGLLPVMKERAPHLTLILEENFTSVLTERLKAGQLDVVVITFPFEEAGTRTQPLYEEPFVVLMPDSHPLASQETVDIRRLERETVLLLGKGHCFRDQVLDFCPPCGRSAADDDLQLALAGGSLETIRYMVASGAGVTILPATAACADRFPQRLLAIRRFTGAPPCRRVALAWRSGFARMEAIAVLRDSILASAPTCVRLLDPGTLDQPSETG